MNEGEPAGRGSLFVVRGRGVRGHHFEKPGKVPIAASRTSICPDQLFKDAWGNYERILRPSSRKMPLNIISSACGLLALARASFSEILRSFTRSYSA